MTVDSLGIPLSPRLQGGRVMEHDYNIKQVIKEPPSDMFIINFNAG